MESTTKQDVLTPAQARCLRKAYSRPEHFVCPTPGLWAAAQTSVLSALRAGGYITNDAAPVLTEKGLAVAADLVAKAEGK
jgi:hypothetical protein